LKEIFRERAIRHLPRNELEDRRSVPVKEDFEGLARADRCELAVR